VFPPDAKRVGAGETPKPYIVRREQVVAPCAYVKRAEVNPVSEKKKAQKAVTTRNGKRVA
jgi:hypothetical protein